MAHRITRDCPATLIPAGDTATLREGQMVEVMQTLGGNVTVRTDEGLFRISSENASAVEGLSLSSPESEAPGVFSEKAVWDVMRTCFDPEIPINIVDLGLIYDLSIEKTPSGANAVDVKMTLTAPGCGMGPVIAEDARQKIAALPAVERAKVHIVWDPVWNPRMISDAGRKTLGLE
jgi:probable FeS assembly SUF system protein SufT